MRPAALINGPVSRVGVASFLPRCTSARLVRMASSNDTGGAGLSGRSKDEQLLSVAPMMDWTDVHYRQLARIISKRTWLWTEMVVDATVVHTPNKDRYLWFPEEQRPIVCQLGGSDPQQLAAAAKIVAEYGYDEINLNCGCPSDRVAGAGCFGASLMLQPETVGAACAAMAEAVQGTPVTVKCRLGVDHVDSYADVVKFVATVSEASPVKHFVIHARKCHLKGLNPHQNRTIPPLRYEWVWALKRDFPHLDFSLNGGVLSCHEAADALQTSVDSASIHGVMIGRAAYNYPWHCLGDADRAVFGEEQNAATSRRQVLEEYAKYADGMIGRFGRRDDGHVFPSARTMLKPLLGMFHGERGGRRFRALIDRAVNKAPKDVLVSEVLAEALQAVPEEILDAPPPTLSSESARSDVPNFTGRDAPFSSLLPEMPPLAGSAEAATTRAGAARVIVRKGKGGKPTIVVQEGGSSGDGDGGGNGRGSGGRDDGASAAAAAAAAAAGVPDVMRAANGGSGDAAATAAATTATAGAENGGGGHDTRETVAAA